MEIIRVTPQDLRSTAAQLNSGSAEIAGHLAKMRGQVQSMAVNWQGSAALSFDDLYREWDTAAARLREALENISRRLVNAAENYESAERANVNTIKNG